MSSKVTFGEIILNLCALNLHQELASMHFLENVSLVLKEDIFKMLVFDKKERKPQGNKYVKQSHIW